MQGNGFHSTGPEREKRELRKIAEFFNRIELDDEIDVATREQLRPLIEECTEAL